MVTADNEFVIVMAMVPRPAYERLQQELSSTENSAAEREELSGVERNLGVTREMLFLGALLGGIAGQL